MEKEASTSRTFRFYYNYLVFRGFQWWNFGDEREDSRHVWRESSDPAAAFQCQQGPASCFSFLILRIRSGAVFIALKLASLSIFFFFSFCLFDLQLVPCSGGCLKQVLVFKNSLFWFINLAEQTSVKVQHGVPFQNKFHT